MDHPPQPSIPAAAAAAAAPVVPQMVPTYAPAGYSQVTLQAPSAGLVKPMGAVATAAFSQNVTRTSPATVSWLHDHFEAAEGVSLGRSTLYQHYCDHCTLNRYDPVNQASFGKLIRSVFPNLKTRRLGTRGNSKYHYYGIRLKDSSPLSFPTDQVGGAHNRYRSRQPSDKQPKVKKPASSLGRPESGDVEAFLNGAVLLPDFPVIPGDDFSKMYHANCKEVLRLASKAEFAKVQGLWEKFWASQVRPMLTTAVGIAHVLRCDDLFLTALGRTVMFDVLAPMPENLVRELRLFSKCIEAWTKTAMVKYPALLDARLARIRPLAHNLRRFTTLNHLAQAARPVLGNSEQTTQMTIDLGALEFVHINIQARDVCGCGEGLFADRVESEFKQCLHLRYSAEQWVNWVQKVLRDFVGAGDPTTLPKQFLMRWSLYSSLVMRDLTLRSAPSFGAFHLCLLFLDEALIYFAEQAAEKGLIALTTEYRPLARRPAPMAEEADGDDMDDMEDPEDFDMDDGESRSGMPGMSFLGQLGGASPLPDYLSVDKF